MHPEDGPGNAGGIGIAAAGASPLPLPLSIEDVDCDWLTRAFRVNAPGVTVDNFEIVDIVRNNCTKLRLRLKVDERGKQAGIPDVVILKTGFESHSRQTAFTLRAEPLAYRDLMPGSGLNGPKCFFSDFDADRIQGATIMEDLAGRNVTFGHPLVSRSHDDIAATLTLLAKFHSQSWNRPKGPQGDRLDWIETAAPFTRPVPRSWLEADAWQEFCEMPRGAACSKRFLDRSWMIDALERMHRFSEQVPNCIIHGDSHVGNVFFEPDGTPGFFDITPRRAPAMSEVANHIVLALDVADRSRWEAALVRHYLDELRSAGIADVPGFDDAMRQYSIFLLETFGTVITNRSTVMPESWSTANASRCNLAMLENDTMGRLRELP